MAAAMDLPGYLARPEWDLSAAGLRRSPPPPPGPAAAVVSDIKNPPPVDSRALSAIG